MRAVVQRRAGGPEELVVEEVPDPVPGPGQVLIDVEAAGVHLVDTTIRAGGEWAGGPVAFPMTPGREVAGRVSSVGPDVDQPWVGRRVVVHLGMANGGYASRAVADVAALFELPEHVAAADAVAMVGTGRTAVAICDLAQPSSDDVVLVTGAAGGLGAVMLQMAANAGSVTVGVAGGPLKTAALRALGTDVVVDHHDADWPDRVRVALGERRVTVVLDGVGGPLGRSAFELIEPGGRMVLFGAASGESMQFSIDDLYSYGVTLSAAIGARLAVPGAMQAAAGRAVQLLIEGAVQPLVHEPFALDDAPDAHRALEERTAVGKVVLVP